MKPREPVYLAADPLDAEIVRGWLHEHRIPVRIEGAMLWAGAGELAVNTWPRLFVEDQRDFVRARQLIEQREERRRQTQKVWACSCGEQSPETFDLCWSCGRDRPF